MMRTTTLINVTLVGCMLISAPVCYAGFSTYSSNWPDDATTVNEKVSAPALPSDCAPPPEVPCTDQTDKTKYKATERICDYRRLYAKLGLTFQTAQIRNITNTSQPALSAAYVLNTSANEDYVSWEAGLGTKFKYLRTELEYLYEKDIPYNATPLFAGRAENLTSSLTTQAVWLTLLYDLDKVNLPYFTPYFGGSLGFVWNKTRSTMYGGTGTGAAKDHSNYALGWGVTFGIRVPFWTRWFGYLGYKYMDQGKVRYESYSGVMELKGHSVVQGIDLGVQYLLG